MDSADLAGHTTATCSTAVSEEKATLLRLRHVVLFPFSEERLHLHIGSMVSDCESAVSTQNAPKHVEGLLLQEAVKKAAFCTQFRLLGWSSRWKKSYFIKLHEISSVVTQQATGSQIYVQHDPNLYNPPELGHEGWFVLAFCSTLLLFFASGASPNLKCRVREA